MFGSSPEFVMGLGSLDMLKDGRDVNDNIQLIYKYPNGQKMTYSSISTSQFLPYFNASRPEMGEIIMGTDGTVEITVGRRQKSCDRVVVSRASEDRFGSAGEEGRPFRRGRHDGGGGRRRGWSDPANDERHGYHGNDGFLSREVKFARRWLYQKGVFVQEEPVNPVDTELRSFFQNCRDGQRPRADLEVGLADAVAVMLSNQAMDEGRKVYFNEIEKMGRSEAPGHKTL